jgi:acetyltransferase-like isoleucine patch superfamily enzyme
MNNFRLFSRIKRSNISEDVVIGYFNKIYNSSIDRYTYLGNECIINECDIGRYCSIASNVKIGLGKHPVTYMSTSPLFYAKINPFKTRLVFENKFKECEKTVIGSDVWIGFGAIIKDGIIIENGAIIGAGAVVTKDVSSYSVVAGVPAKHIKYRFDSDIVKNLLDLRWWEYDLQQIRKVVELFSGDVTIEKIQKVKSILKCT